MSIVDSVRNAILTDTSSLPEEQRLDNYVRDRIARSDARMMEILPSINERYEFWRGNQYAYVSGKNKLMFLPTKTLPNGGGKKPWLSRSVNNLLMDIVAYEVSAVTQRIPSYEASPTSIDPEKQSAARTSEQVALYGYEQWDVQLAAIKAVTHAVVGQEGFVWPYFDTSVGPMIVSRDGQSAVGRGEVKMRVFGPQDVMWEPGVRFEDSPYHIVVQEQTLQQVVNTPAFFGEIVTPDSEIARGVGRRGWGKAHNAQLVRVYTYLEKPSRSYPVGRMLTIANGRVIAQEQKYPFPEGDALVKLSYIVDPDNDRDMGLVQHLMDPQRMFNDAWNKIVEWKNLALNPQLFVAPGVLQGQVITSEPGAVYQIADPKNNVMWREVPALPQELFQIAQQASGLIAKLAAQTDMQQYSDAAARAIQTILENELARRYSFITQLARMHGEVASRALYLVQNYYSEPRLLRIKGRWSTDVIRDFKGAQLLGQVDVRVSPSSIEPRTKASMEQKVMAYADRGWITAEQAMAAIEGGYVGDLVTSYELDQGRVLRLIGRLKAGPEALYGTPDKPAPSRTEVDPTTGQQTEVPDFMPRLFDNVTVQKSILEDWMKTEEFESQPPDIQAVANEIYLAMLRIEAQKKAEEQMQAQAVAQQKGQQNAARGGFGGQPDAPAAVSDTGLPALQTPNQPADQNVPDSGQS